MDWWQALLLGWIEGVTEYLPVSSTGHLLVAQRLLGIAASDAANAYAIAIQAGAIVAVLGLYRQRVGQMARGFFGGDIPGRRLLVCVLVAFLPAAVLGLLLDDFIESRLFGPWPIVGAWLLGGLAILWFDRRVRGGPRDVEAMTWRAALFVGVMQCLALWPGTSRSLATILGGLLVGLTLPAAVEFSFLLGLVTLGAATTYKAVQHGATMLADYGFLAVAVGFVMAWLSATIAVRWMVAWLGRNGLALFGWWRLVVGGVVAGLILGGVI